MELEPLINRFRGPLIGLLAAWGASPRDAIELAQDVFAEAYLSRDRFRGDWEEPTAAGAWLRGIALNLYRTSRRRNERSGTSIDGEERPEPAASEEPVEDPRTAKLRSAIDGLRESWRTVLHMRYVEGSGLAEIAALLETSERSVEGRLHRARNELKRVLAEPGESASRDERDTSDRERVGMERGDE